MDKAQHLMLSRLCKGQEHSTACGSFTDGLWKREGRSYSQVCRALCAAQHLTQDRATGACVLKKGFGVQVPDPQTLNVGLHRPSLPNCSLISLRVCMLCAGRHDG
eukprot:1158950-Pelagomonas_calceolata.AAC.2